MKSFKTTSILTMQVLHILTHLILTMTLQVRYC